MNPRGLTLVSWSHGRWLLFYFAFGFIASVYEASYTGFIGPKNNYLVAGTALSLAESHNMTKYTELSIYTFASVAMRLATLLSKMLMTSL